MQDKILQQLLILAPTISQKLRQGFGKFSKKQLQTKDLSDITTYLDHEIGKIISKNLLREFPEIAIESEESEERYGKSNIVVRFDPIDGTKHLVNKISLITSSIAVIVEGEVQIGVIVDPFSNKIFYAQKRKGAFLNGKKIRAKETSIAKTIVAHELPTSTLFDKNPRLFNRHTKLLESLIKKSYRLINIGISSLSICWVAEGLVSAFVDFSGTTKIYDIEAGALIAREAGALVGNFQGKILGKFNSEVLKNKKIVQDEIVVANKKSFKEITKIFKKN